ncbi:hypothetical protein AAFF_G00415710 [Aldrovandia affinis]|uniref:Uncharacterized protein n=1 Tax=Aldrovandia affinis TaxID=143900 RepID=A0AAD7WJG6_9TELE|nr:hypothetical protein AAFF_G00415710 [Aldrovandia affinis]
MQDTKRCTGGLPLSLKPSALLALPPPGQATGTRPCTGLSAVYRREHVRINEQTERAAEARAGARAGVHGERADKFSLQLTRWER